MADKKLKIEVHESHLPLWERKDWRYAFFMGGRGNGRSGSASRFCLTSLLGQEYTRGALMRAIREDIRSSCWSEMIDRLEETETTELFRVVDNEMKMVYGENSLRAFGFKASSGSLKARLKSLASFNFAWIEEFEEIGETEFSTFDDSLRTTKGRTRIIGSTNPPSKDHWFVKRFFDLTPHPEAPGFYIPSLKAEHEHNVLFIPGTFRQNIPNMDPGTVERYLGYRETKPAYYWQQIEGLVPDVIIGRIYQGWREIPEVPHEARLLGYGLDFGFDPDPAAVVAVYYHNGGYIFDEKVYSNGLVNADLAASLKLLPVAPIVADSAEPKSIAELKRYGVHAIPVTKGADSVNFGIKHMQGLRISYTADSTNFKTEYENYAWKIDKDGNNLGIEDPKCMNHLMSAARYFALELIRADADPDSRDRQTAKNDYKNRQAVNTVKNRYGLN